MLRICKINIAAKHISAAHICHAVQIGNSCSSCRRTDEFIHVFRRKVFILACTIRHRFSASIPDMHIALVVSQLLCGNVRSVRSRNRFRISIVAAAIRNAELTLIRKCIDFGRPPARRRLNRCIVHDAHASSFEYDLVRLERSGAIDEADNIGFCRRIRRFR